MKTSPSIFALFFLALSLGIASCGGVKKEKVAEVKKAPDTVVVERVVERVDTVRVVESNEAEAIKADNQLVRGDFYVIGGSFKEADRADRFQQDLVKKGYQAQILKPYNGFTRVAIRAFSEEANARGELTKLRKEFNNVSFWLLMPS